VAPKDYLLSAQLAAARPNLFMKFYCQSQSKFSNMSNEDQNFGAPTHTCVHCSHCFLATWDTDEDGDRLSLDLLSCREAILAKEQGCQFYTWILKHCLPDEEDTRVRFVIEKKTRIEYWDSVDPYLVVAEVHPDGHDERYDPSQLTRKILWAWLKLTTSIFPAASRCRHCVTKAVLRYFRVFRASSLV
jgi:hypothetical protein